MIARRALLLAALGGCTLLDAPIAGQDADRLRAGTHALLLLRLVATDQDGADRATLRAGWSDTPVSAMLGDFDSGGEPRPFLLRSPSAAARDAGWAVAVLEPGRYYLSVAGPARGEDIAWSDAAGHPPRWRIELPRGAAAIYAGTLHLGEVSGAGIFSRLRLGFDLGRTRVLDETSAAVAIAARDLSGWPPPRTRLMQRHEGPILLGPPRD